MVFWFWSDFDHFFSKKAISQARACPPSPNCEPKGWSSWSQWSQCPVTCGKSMIQRSRTCKGNSCPGVKTETSPCEKGPCMSFRSLKVEGKFPGKDNPQAPKDHLWSWGGWGEWAACTKSCGTGLTWRKRTCGRGQCSLAPVGVREVKTCYISGSFFLEPWPWKSQKNPLRFG